MDQEHDETRLSAAGWRKSRRSNSQGACVELSRLADGGVAVRNSRFPRGPALVCTRAEVRALIDGVKDGDLDDLLRDLSRAAVIARSGPVPGAAVSRSSPGQASPPGSPRGPAKGPGRPPRMPGRGGRFRHGRLRMGGTPSP